MTNENIVILTEKDLEKMSLLLTPKGEFKANSKYDKGDSVYCGYSIYISLVPDNQALLSDTTAWRMIIDGSHIKDTIDETNRLQEDIEQLKDQTDNIYSQENSRVLSENQRALTFNKLVDNLNTLMATASNNERSRSDAFNKNEQARQKDWYEQLTEDHNQYTKLWTEIKQSYNDFADGATLNEKTRQTVFDELKLALDNLKIDAIATNEQAKTALANAQIAETTASNAAATVTDAVKRANDAADKANESATKVNDGVNAAKQALDNANTAITTANTAKSAADEAKTNADTAAANANAAADKANAAATKATDAATKAENVAEHAPFIDGDGYFNKYDATTNSFVKTDVNLKGPKGDTGEKGEKGEKGDPSVTKEAVEAVLTGNITTHTHDQYITKIDAENTYIKKGEAGNENVTVNYNDSEGKAVESLNTIKNHFDTLYNLSVKNEVSSISVDEIKGLFNAMTVNSNSMIKDITYNNGAEATIGSAEAEGVFTAVVTPSTKGFISWNTDNSLLTIDDEGNFTEKYVDADTNVTVTARIYVMKADVNTEQSKLSKIFILKKWNQVFAKDKDNNTLNVLTDYGSNTYYKNNAV